MSWTDEEIDKLAQESAETPAFKYKDEYWTEFEAMLPKSGGKGFAWYFTAFLFVGLLSTSLVLKESIKANEIKLVNEQDVESPLVAASVEKSNFKKELNETAKAETKIISQSNELSQKPVISALAVNKDYSITKSVKVKNLKQIQKNSVNLVASTNDLNEISVDPSVIDKLFIKNNGESTESVLVETSNELVATELNDFTSDVRGIDEINEDSEFEWASNRDRSENVIETISTLPLLSLDQSLEVELIPLSLHNDRELPARATFYVEAFGGLSESLITPSNDMSTSFGLGLGAQIQKGRFTFTTGVNGVWSNHKDLNLTRSAKVYNFGSNQYNYEFKYKQIYTLEAELTIGYKLGRHSINAGVRPSVIVGTKVGISESIDEKSSLDRNEYGYVNGLNRFGIKPMLGYSFDVTSSLKVGVNVGVELSPKIQQGFLEGNSNRYPIDGQIYLRHSIKFKR